MYREKRPKKASKECIRQDRCDMTANEGDGSIRHIATNQNEKERKEQEDVDKEYELICGQNQLNWYIHLTLNSCVEVVIARLFVRSLIYR